MKKVEKLFVCFYVTNDKASCRMVKEMEEE